MTMVWEIYDLMIDNLVHNNYRTMLEKNHISTFNKRMKHILSLENPRNCLLSLTARLFNVSYSI